VEQRSKQMVQQEDVLSLPPRSEIHRQKKSKKRVKWKLKYPVIRLLALFFILLPISMLSIYYANNDSKTVTVVTRSETSSYEQIDITPVEEKVRKLNAKKEDRSESDAQKEDKSSDERKIITHTVQENETLYSIAMKYYQSDKGMEIIKKWNHLKSAQLHKGQVLQIPVMDVEK
jgi:LysM repeat protein